MITRPEKELATAQAKALLIGATLQAIEDDRGTTVYILTKTHVTRQLRTLEEVNIWIDHLGGRAG